MSLMGYTEDDIVQMKVALAVVLEDNRSPFITTGLSNAMDLLEGLLAEGRV